MVDRELSKYHKPLFVSSVNISCPSDGDVKSEVPCSVGATPVYVKDPFSSSSIFGAVFVKSRHQYEADT